jgi:hypothetical protein
MLPQISDLKLLPLACTLDGENSDFSEVIMRAQNLQVVPLLHSEYNNGADYDHCADCDDVLLLENYTVTHKGIITFLFQV